MYILRTLINLLCGAHALKLAPIITWVYDPLKGWTYSSPDSVHNDGERHIPYITVFPNSTINKLYAWAKFQLPNGMIQEMLRIGGLGIPLSPQVSYL